MMAVLLDIYGNEARILIDANDFCAVRKKAPAKAGKAQPKKKVAAKKTTGKTTAKKRVRK